MRTKSILLSLSEPVGMVQSAFRQYIASILLQGRIPSAALSQPGILRYDPVPYLMQLVQEIFRNAGNPEVFGHISESTRILIHDGLEREIAMRLTLNVFNCIVDIISTNIPGISFDTLVECGFTICNDRDLFITLPVLQV